MGKTLPTLLVLVGLVACRGDATGDSSPASFLGTYRYSGTVRNQPTMNVVGSLSITAQTGTTAIVNADLLYRDGTETLLRLATAASTNATITSGGEISFTFTAQALVGNDPVIYTVKHEGRLAASTISGTWTLTSQSSSDAGSFSAER